MAGMKEYYDPANISFSNGSMIFTANKLITPYTDYCDLYTNSATHSYSRTYSGAAIITKYNMEPNGCPGSLGFKYGMFEIRCKMPNQTGFYPGFWLWNGDKEIDIFEASDPQNIYSTIHVWRDQDFKPYETPVDKGGNGIYPHPSCSQRIEKQGLDLSQDFHTYTAVWTPTKVTWFFDGKETWTNDYYPVNITCPAFLMLNLAVTDQAIAQSAQLTIDYIKVYKPINGDYSLPYKSSANWGTHPINNNLLIAQKISSANGAMGSYYNGSHDEVYYRDKDNMLRHYYWSGSGFNNELVPFTYDQYRYIGGDLIVSQIDGTVIYRGSNGRLQSFYKDASFHHADIDDNWVSTTGVVSSNPGSIALGTNNNIYYRGADNKLHLYYWNSSISDWSHELSSITYDTYSYIDGEVVVGAGDQVFYRGYGGKLQTQYKNNGTWYRDFVDANWANTNMNVSPAYGAIAVVKPNNDIYYRGADNTLYKFYWQNGWHGSQILVSGMPITVNGKITFNYNSTTGDIQLYFRGTDNKMNIVSSYAGGWTRDWLSSWGWLSPETVVNGDNYCNGKENIYYRFSDEFIHRFSWEACENLNPPCSSHLTVYKKGDLSSQTSINNNISIEVFPNPSLGVFQVNWSGKSYFNVEVIDQMGQQLLQKTSNNENATIDISNQKEGMYLIKLTDGNEVVNRKVIIKK